MLSVGYINLCDSLRNSYLPTKHNRLLFRNEELSYTCDSLLIQNLDTFFNGILGLEGLHHKSPDFQFHINALQVVLVPQTYSNLAVCIHGCIENVDIAFVNIL